MPQYSEHILRKHTSGVHHTCEHQNEYHEAVGQFEVCHIIIRYR